jgi:hypothetical protein
LVRHQQLPWEEEVSDIADVADEDVRAAMFDGFAFAGHDADSMIEIVNQVWQEFLEEESLEDSGEGLNDRPPVRLDKRHIPRRDEVMPGARARSSIGHAASKSKT